MSQTLRLGLFIIATLVILTIGVFLIGGNQALFERTYQVRSTFQNVSGLNPGADVRVGGIHEGTVKHIDLPRNPEGDVTVVMNLANITRDVLKEDSVASIQTEGLVGDKYVEISFGSTDARQLKNGDTIQSEPPLDISDLLKKTDQIMDSAKEAVQNIQATANNLDSISSKINQGEGSVGALINNKSLYQQANAGTAAFRDDMEALKHNFLLRGFFNKRGYEDSDELTKHQIASLPPRPYTKEFAYDATKLFDKEAKLRNQKMLNEAGKYLEQNKFGEVVVAASAGPKGETDKDHVLTEARSMVVRDYLADNFRLDDDRIKTVALGKTAASGSLAGRDDASIQIFVYATADSERGR
jgi:phospholipid/cholesterol/gamma-HCH transport system substrate-binding protein